VTSLASLSLRSHNRRSERFVELKITWLIGFLMQ
jgi:hypothetical protein